MGLTKEIYRSRYRALGKQLEVERFQISEQMNKDAQNPVDNYALFQDEFETQCKDRLIELNKLEKLLF